MAASKLKALIVQHEEPTPAGLLGDWLDRQNAEVDVLRIDLDEVVPDPREFQLIAYLGSEFAAFDDSVPFVQRESELIRQAAKHDVPMLGLCFGGQLMARALGGESFRSERPEIGWLRVRTKDAELISEGPWFEWHFDSFTLPPGARLIADTDVGPRPTSSEEAWASSSIRRSRPRLWRAGSRPPAESDGWRRPGSVGGGNQSASAVGAPRHHEAVRPLPGEGRHGGRRFHLH